MCVGGRQKETSVRRCFHAGESSVDVSFLDACVICREAPGCVGGELSPPEDDKNSPPGRLRSSRGSPENTNGELTVKRE